LSLFTTIELKKDCFNHYITNWESKKNIKFQFLHYFQ